MLTVMGEANAPAAGPFDSAAIMFEMSAAQRACVSQHEPSPGFAGLRV